MNRKKWGFILILLVTISFSLLYWLWPKQDDLTVIGEVEPFTLEDVFGESYELDNGKIKLITFFYTKCPDVCPLTMKYMANMVHPLQDMLGEQVEFVSITLDPEHDTKSIIQHYASSFTNDDNGWYWVRTTPNQTRDIAKQFQMVYEKTSDGFVAHSTTVYLVDPNHHIRAIYDMATTEKPLNTDQIMKDIKELAQRTF
ncbi:SCO family protein [Salirhabdus salicampi]|uniref:SCO family protein n=1 Tax=Salirhabdus salicampi TaxID=476102 RepID=UPI0020C3D1D9|nr:SCO family protein [Salirhabdus salicampi]MCP8616012.1 SCO family protein [Salirhabdus salicampi]